MTERNSHLGAPSIFRPRVGFLEDPRVRGDEKLVTHHRTTGKSARAALGCCQVEPQDKVSRRRTGGIDGDRKTSELAVDGLLRDLDRKESLVARFVRLIRSAHKLGTSRPRMASRKAKLKVHYTQAALWDAHDLGTVPAHKGDPHDRRRVGKIRTLPTRPPAHVGIRLAVLPPSNETHGAETQRRPARDVVVPVLCPTWQSSAYQLPTVLNPYAPQTAAPLSRS